MAELVVLGIDNAYDAHRILAEMSDVDVGRGPEPDSEDGVAGLLVSDSSMQSRLGPRAGGGDMSGSLYDCGVEEGFVLSLAEMLEADAAALFLVVRKSQTGQVLEELSGFPGRVLRSSFSVDQIPRLRRALSDVCAAAG